MFDSHFRPIHALMYLLCENLRVRHWLECKKPSKLFDFQIFFRVKPSFATTSKCTTSLIQKLTKLWASGTYIKQDLRWFKCLHWVHVNREVVGTNICWLPQGPLTRPRGKPRLDYLFSWFTKTFFVWTLNVLSTASLCFFEKREEPLKTIWSTGKLYHFMLVWLWYTFFTKLTTKCTLSVVIGKANWMVNCSCGNLQPLRQSNGD